MASRKKKRLICLVLDCLEPPHLGGLCAVHHDERAASDRRKRAAHTALHEFTVDGKAFEIPAVREEMLRLRQWWFDACDALRLGIERKVRKDEAEDAMSWCTSLAQELADAERRGRTGATIESDALFGVRHWVWERLGFLEAGLHSNGLPRDQE